MLCSTPVSSRIPFSIPSSNSSPETDDVCLDFAHGPQLNKRRRKTSTSTRNLFQTFSRSNFNSDIIEFSSVSSDECGTPNVQILVPNITMTVYLFFSKLTISLSAKDIIKLCYGEFDDQFLCKKKPLGVRYNAIFYCRLASR